MNEIEADVLVARLREAAVAQDLDDRKVEGLAEWLIPLPFDVCERRVEQWAAAAVAVDGQGRRVEKWVSSVDHVLAAVGVDAAARQLVAQAKAEGRQLWPSLRGVGWEFAAPDGALPRGVGEFYANLRLPIPDGRLIDVTLPIGAPERTAGPTRALPSGGALDAATALATIGRDLADANAAALRSRFEVLRHPPSEEIDLEALPPALRRALEAADAERDRLVAARRRCEAQEQAYREMAGELAELIRRAAPDYQTARTVALELLQRVLREGDVGAVLELVRDALNPALAIAVCDVKRGPSEDPFDDAPGPIEAVRVVITRRS